MLLSIGAVGASVASLLVGAILGYAFRGKIHTGIVDAGKAAASAVSTAVSDVEKKV